VSQLPPIVCNSGFAAVSFHHLVHMFSCYATRRVKLKLDYKQEALFIETETELIQRRKNLDLTFGKQEELCLFCINVSFVTIDVVARQ